MNVETFAEWLRRQGHRVYQTESSYWYDAGPRVLQAFPYHWLIQPTEQEIRKLLLGKGIVSLRYSTPVESPVGCISYHAVYDEPQYTLEGLERRSRQNVRTGLKNCQVEPISLKRLAEEGWNLELDTVSRQGRRPSMTKDAWQQRYMAAADLPGFEAWGALVEGQLAAALLSFQMEDCCELLTQQCHNDYLNARINNALSFVVTQTMVNRPSIRSIFYTLQSLDAPPSVDEFKFRMGYKAKPVRQRVVFHPWCQLFANRFVHHALIRLLQHDSANPKLAKAEGVLRFNLQGKLPLREQNWPEFLAPEKEELLNFQAM
jgi:hypothetical protein